jgi:MIP family channel proteins
MSPLFRRAVAEMIGTFFLCFVGIMAICMNKGLLSDATRGTIGVASAETGSGPLGVALAHGLALAIAITALGKVSGGHFNPVVSLSVLLSRQMGIVAAVVYVLSQLAGGILGAFAAKLVVPEATFGAAAGGVPSIAHGVTLWQAVLVEAIATFFLVIAVFGTGVDPNGPKVGGFAIGLTVAFDILAIGPMTGGAMNPARALGPAMASGDWANHWVYWAGPVAGGVIAGWIYTLLFLKYPPAKPAGSDLGGAKKPEPVVEVV